MVCFWHDGFHNAFILHNSVWKVCKVTPKIVNESYREFIDKGTIHIMPPEEFHRKLDTVKLGELTFKRHEWLNYLLLLYWSGRRPAEILKLKGKDFSIKGNFICIMFETLKKGRTTMFYFNFKKVPDIKKVFDWAKLRHLELLLFQSLISSHKKTVKWKTKAGELRQKTYAQPSANITFYVKKFFGVPPYFFRHNRFSDMSMQGATSWQIKHVKGSKDLRSVDAYIHLSEKGAKEAAKFIK